MKASTKPEPGALFLDEPQLDGAFGLNLRVDQVLHHEKSSFQDIYVIESGPLGRVLILDGVIQTTLWDEAGYHEMLAHPPLLTHPDPKSVLVIGGGDGGTLREVGRHKSVERMDICEIDGRVIELCKEFLPELAAGYDDPRVTVHLADGIGFAADHPDEYDVILVDSPDPVGPAQGLFGREFYRSVRQALRPAGVVASQGETYFAYPDLIRDMLAFMSEIFERTNYYQTIVPTYVTGIIGFAVNTLGPDPLTGPDPERAAALPGLRYYTPWLHKGAFVLPKACHELLPPEAARRQAMLFE